MFTNILNINGHQHLSQDIQSSDLWANRHWYTQPLESRSTCSFCHCWAQVDGMTSHRIECS